MKQYNITTELACYPQTLYSDFRLKRAVDVIISAILLILISPLLISVAALIYLDSPGPILFRQQRVGKKGQLFTFWKFRSMSADAEQHKLALITGNDVPGGVLFKLKQDPRITRVGKWIRRFSIDELPQLWNVLKGEMSLVGPRPALPEEVAQYTLYQYQRLAITPGITCLWQISGRSDISFLQQVELDLQYIAIQSFWCDTLILLRTIPAVLRGRGAY
jgi:exopolysaccharide biosynthesis polyprenyl glycosylphosphotransferase